MGPLYNIPNKTFVMVTVLEILMLFLFEHALLAVAIV